MQVYLYSEPGAKTLDVGQLAGYVESLLSILVEARGAFVHRYREGQRDALDTLALHFAQAKVRNPQKEGNKVTPLPGEVDYEKRRLADPQSRTFGLLYDGYQLMTALGHGIPREERGLKHVHIVFTNQLFGTWDEADRRYHARVSLYGFPSLISTTGIVEAPAKPRQYYFLKQQYTALGLADAPAVALEPQFRHSVIGHEDERLTEVMKGYVMQAIMYHVSGGPFCPDRHCRLFNAHWQEEVIRAQLGGDYEFCPRHREQMEAMRLGRVP
ncbi:MAG: hypothetical protein HYU86_08825 [Chloroflexi bacterium]|nr:hypothetical protein [Chloroflexota bacterium]